MSVGIVSPNLGGPYRVKDLIYDAYIIAKVLGRGESLSYVKAGPYVLTINELVEQASLKKTFSTYQANIQVPLVANQASYTIGPSTVSPIPDVQVPRPLEIMSGYSRQNGSDSDVYVTHRQEDYDRISNKGNLGAGYTSGVYYQATYPAGTIYVYPVPADSSTVLFLTVLSTLSKYSSLEEEIVLPPGYQRWFKYELAKVIAPTAGLTLSPESREVLAEAKEALQTNNIKAMPAMSTGIGNLGTAAGCSGYDVRNDSYRGSM